MKLPGKLWTACAVWAAVCACFTATAAAQSAELKIEPPEYDFGKISSSQIVKHTFLLRNSGGATLYIRDITVTCGCTLVDVSSKSIEPGKSASLTLQIEPDAKEGPIEKTITIATNDPRGPLRALRVRAEIQRDLHKMSALEKEKSIFSPECRSCHVDGGTGKTGKDLYQADCAMCHGSLEERDHVRSLNVASLAEDLQELRKTIALGNGRGTMPGFSAAAGGPLSDAQIDSLVDLFIKWQKTEKGRHGGGR
ncbi:MAG: DUF1573 domain-containing protein [Acidobacteria bacterium]|nr:DUF1573 domain-containing protein [Acidobacteriota bacterium]